MMNLNEIKITPRDGEVPHLAQACSNKEIAGQLNISPRTVKQHLRTLFLRAGITEGRSEACRRNVCQGADGILQPRDQLTRKEIQAATPAWEGLTNRESAKIIGTTEGGVKNHLRTAFDKLGVWSRLELLRRAQLESESEPLLGVARERWRPSVGGGSASLRGASLGSTASVQAEREGFQSPTISTVLPTCVRRAFGISGFLLVRSMGVF